MSTQELQQGWSLQWDGIWSLEGFDASQQQSEETTMEKDQHPGE